MALNETQIPEAGRDCTHFRPAPSILLNSVETHLLETKKV